MGWGGVGWGGVGVSCSLKLTHWTFVCLYRIYPASFPGALTAFLAQNTVTCMTRDVARGWKTNGKRGATDQVTD